MPSRPRQQNQLEHHGGQTQQREEVADTAVGRAIAACPDSSLEDLAREGLGPGQHPPPGINDGRGTRGRGAHQITTLLDGTQIVKLEGLREHLLTKRRDKFVRQFCRKLLGYSLGRAIQLSDEPLLDDMLERLSEEGYRFSVAVDTIVLSDQFNMIRGRE